MDEIKRALLEALTEYYQPEKELADLVKTNERTIRMAIRSLIADGYPIISSSYKGVKLTNDPEELIERAESLKHIGIEYIIRRRDLMRCAKKLQGQLSLRF